MKLLSSALALCMLSCCLAKAGDTDKCGCMAPKPKPTQPTQAQPVKPQRTAAAPACPCPEQKTCPTKPKA